MFVKHAWPLSSSILSLITFSILFQPPQSHGHPQTLSSRNYSTSQPTTFCSSGSFHLVIFHSVNFLNLLRPLLFPLSPYPSSIFCLLFLPYPGRLSRFMTLTSDLCPRLRFSVILLFHLPDKTWNVYLECSVCLGQTPGLLDTAGENHTDWTAPKSWSSGASMLPAIPTTLPGPPSSFFWISRVAISRIFLFSKTSCLLSLSFSVGDFISHLSRGKIEVTGCDFSVFYASL